MQGKIAGDKRRIPQSGVVTGLVTTLVLHFFSHTTTPYFLQVWACLGAKIVWAWRFRPAFPACQFPLILLLLMAV
jgi:hypothetical protein